MHATNFCLSSQEKISQFYISNLNFCWEFLKLFRQFSEQSKNVPVMSNLVHPQVNK